MPLRIRFVGMTRMSWLRLVLVSAMVLGMLVSIPLWLTSRDFFLLPVAKWIPAPQTPWDKVLFAALLLTLVLSFRWYRPAIILFLSGSLYLYLIDQNRGQPWFYLYWVMMLLTLFSEAAALGGCRLVIAAVYLWAGIQKCHSGFFDRMAPWFVQPAQSWGLSSGMVKILQWGVASAPFTEIFIALALWWRGWRWLALGAGAGLHLIVLLFLGPLGHNYNHVIWPWNLAMIGFLLVLVPNANLKETVVELKRSPAALAITAAICLLPALHFMNRWDTYFSFSLYSGDQAQADIFVSDRAGKSLPADLQPFVHEVKQTYHPQLQGPFVFDYQTWASIRLKVPPIPEPRNYIAMYRYVTHRSRYPNEVRMLLGDRKGGMTFFQGQQSFPLTNTASAK